MSRYETAPGANAAHPESKANATPTEMISAANGQLHRVHERLDALYDRLFGSEPRAVEPGRPDESNIAAISRSLGDKAREIEALVDRIHDRL